MGIKKQLKKSIADLFQYSDVADKVTLLTLVNAIENCVADIERLDSKSPFDLEDYELQDLEDSLKILNYLTETYIYFSGDYSFKPKFYHG